MLMGVNANIENPVVAIGGAIVGMLGATALGDVLTKSELMEDNNIVAYLGGAIGMAVFMGLGIGETEVQTNLSVEPEIIQVTESLSAQKYPIAMIGDEPFYVPA